MGLLLPMEEPTRESFGFSEYLCLAFSQELVGVNSLIKGLIIETEGT
jgi:hypothetical protein